MSRHVRIAVTALTLNSLAFGPALAQSDICRRASQASGESVSGLSDAKCQEIYQIATEDRWQLQLDSAIAAELGGNEELAWLRLNNILGATSKSDVPLSKAWQGVREDIKEAMQRLEEGLLAKNGRLNLTSTEPGLLVTIADASAYEEAEFAPVTRFLKPGKHTVIVTPTLSAGTEQRYTVDLKQGQTHTLEVSAQASKPETVLTEEAPAVTPPTERVNPPAKLRPLASVAPQKESTSAWKTVGGVAVATGVAALATGGFFILKAEQTPDEIKCWGQACADRDSLRAEVQRRKDQYWDYATITLAAGGALLVGGILAIALSDSDEPVQVSPWFSPEGGGVVGSMRF